MGRGIAASIALSKDKNKIYGYTDTMKLININGSKDLIGKIVNVEIHEAKSFSLDGVVAKESVEN